MRRQNVNRNKCTLLWASTTHMVHNPYLWLFVSPIERLRFVVECVERSTHLFENLTHWIGGTDGSKICFQSIDMWSTFWSLNKPNMVHLWVTTSQHDCYYYHVLLIYMDMNHLFNTLYKIWQLLLLPYCFAYTYEYKYLFNNPYKMWQLWAKIIHFFNNLYKM